MNSIYWISNALKRNGRSETPKYTKIYTSMTFSNQSLGILRCIKPTINVQCTRNCAFRYIIDIFISWNCKIRSLRAHVSNLFLSSEIFCFLLFIAWKSQNVKLFHILISWHTIFHLSIGKNKIHCCLGRYLFSSKYALSWIYKKN